MGSENTKTRTTDPEEGMGHIGHPQNTTKVNTPDQDLACIPVSKVGNEQTSEESPPRGAEASGIQDGLQGERSMSESSP